MSDPTRSGRTQVLRTRSAVPALGEVRASTRDGAAAAVTDRPLVVGRSRACDLVVDDATVSAVHLELVATEDGIRVRDVASSNGTLYADAFVSDAILPSGSTLRVGQTEIVVELALDETGKQRAFDVAEVGQLRGTSAAMRQLYALVGRVAKARVAVLVEGEDGTEKELVARAIHELASPDASFVAVDCASASAAVVTQAAAEAGTLLLLDVASLGKDAQAALEKALASSSARVVATESSDLAGAVNTGRFSEGLYERVAGVRVRVPALRDRPEDITTLVYQTLQAIPADVEAARAVAKDALEDLKRRAWHGNVRELRAVVERAALLAEKATIVTADLGFERALARERIATFDDRDGFKEAKRSVLDEFERGYLARLMERTEQNLGKAAAIAGLERHHLRDLLKKHGLR